jgi:hypothetical protein
MSQLPFFTWHNILCASSVGAVGAACSDACHFSLTLRHTEPSPVRVVAEHNIHYSWQHCVRSARLLRFGEMFQWRKILVCCFGALICNFGACHRLFHSRPIFFTCAAIFFTRAAVFCACDATDDSSKFCSFLFCEMICQNGLKSYFKYKI